MLFGWRVVKHVKSNAIVYAKADRTRFGVYLGSGAWGVGGRELTAGSPAGAGGVRGARGRQLLSAVARYSTRIGLLR